MTEHARRLLRALSDKGICSVKDMGMPEAEIQLAVAELGALFDDANHPVVAVKMWHAGERIVALEITPSGRGLANAAAGP